MTSQTNTGSGVRLFVTLASLIVITAGLKAASAIVVPLLVALFLAMLATPLMFWLRSRKIPTGVSVGFILIILVGIISVVGSLIG